MPQKVYCPYCNRKALFRNSRIVYGKDYGMLYICMPCNAYVGVHKGTDIPLGTLANGEVRYLRHETHKLFDQLWKSKKMSRHNAYMWLSVKMNLPFEDTHIAMFGKQKCFKAISILRDFLRKNKIKECKNGTY